MKKSKFFKNGLDMHPVNIPNIFDTLKINKIGKE